MKKIISRKEAADVLGVSLQTINNWIKKGLISCVTIHGRVNIERSSFDKIKGMLSDVAETENEILRYKKIINEEKSVLENVLQSLKMESNFIKSCNVKSLFSTAYVILSKGKCCDRTIDCVCRFIDGENYSDIGNVYGIKSARARQIVESGIRILNRVDKYSDILRENNRLRDELHRVNVTNKSLKQMCDSLQNDSGKYNIDKRDGDMPDIFYTKLSDIDFTIRCHNCLKSAEIDTVYDLVQFDRKDILKFRNFGHKTLMELDSFLENNGLSFGMKLDDIIKK